jgi:hypothetical protein
MQSARCLILSSRLQTNGRLLFARETQETPKGHLFLSRDLLKVSETEQIVRANSAILL